MSKTKTTKTTETKPVQTPEKKPFVPYTTEQKKEFAKQFTPEQRESYHRGRQNAYQHSANMAGRQAKFIRNGNENS